MVDVHIGSVTKTVSKRVAAIILWLLQHAEDVTVSQKCRVEFNCAGECAVRPALTMFYE